MVRAAASLILAGTLGMLLFLSPSGEAQDSRPTAPERTPIEFPPAGTATVMDTEAAKRLPANHGARVLLVNVWATWCSPCVAELPYFVKISDEYKSKGLLVVGLAAEMDTDPEVKLNGFLKEKKIPYPNFLLDVEPQEFFPFFSPDWTGTLPATFAYDADGNKLGEHIMAMSEDQLRAFVDKALADADKSAAGS